MAARYVIVGGGIAGVSCAEKVSEILYTDNYLLAIQGDIRLNSFNGKTIGKLTSYKSPELYILYKTPNVKCIIVYNTC